jgi:hypothetical protein
MGANTEVEYNDTLVILSVGLFIGLFGGKVSKPWSQIATWQKVLRIGLLAITVLIILIIMLMAL